MKKILKEKKLKHFIKKYFKLKKILFFGDLNLFTIFFFLLFSTLLINTNTAIHLLLTAELLWITLYGIVLYLGLLYDNINLLSLTFFFLIFSAAEFGVGLIVLTTQHLFLRTINLNDNDNNLYKFSNRYLQKLNVTRINWN